MANDIPKSLKYTPIGVEGVVEVKGRLVGSGLVDSLRRTFTIDSQMEQGDYHMDRSLELLEKYLQLMLLRDQVAIRHSYMKARDLKHGLHADDHNGSQFKRFFQAREYRRLSKTAYDIVKFASDRVRENPLISQLAEATQTYGGQSGSGPGIASRLRDPFTDSHAVSTLTEESVNDLDSVGVSTCQEEATNEAVAVSGDRTDREGSQTIVSAPAAVGLHREDGSSPRFIAASPPDDHREDEQGENLT